MKLHEITLGDIQLGRNWLLAPPRQDWSVKFLQIEGEFQPLVKVTPQDQVLYSALVAEIDRRSIAKPLLSLVTTFPGASMIAPFVKQLIAHPDQATEALFSYEHPGVMWLD